MNRLYELYKYKALGYKFIDENSFKESFSAIRFLKNCELCELSKGRNFCFGGGLKKAKVMAIFFSPSSIQDETKSISSQSSFREFKDILIKYLDLNEDEIFTTFLVRCFSKSLEVENSHIKSCKPYLFEEIKGVAPKLILAVGEPCFRALARDELASIEIMHGSTFRLNGSYVVPVFDPDFIKKNPSKKELFLSDIKNLKELL